MTTALTTTLFDAQLLCHVCEERPWTQTAQYGDALICASCAEGEPMPEEDADELAPCGCDAFWGIPTDRQGWMWCENCEQEYEIVTV